MTTVDTVPTEQPSKFDKATTAAIEYAHIIIFLYSTITAVHGICQYAMKVGVWAERRHTEKSIRKTPRLATVSPLLTAQDEIPPQGDPNEQ